MAVVESSKVKNPAGLYRHPESGKELVARQHPKFGSAMADGFVAVGYKFVGEAPVEVKTKAETKTEAK